MAAKAKTTRKKSTAKPATKKTAAKKVKTIAKKSTASKATKSAAKTAVKTTKAASNTAAKAAGMAKKNTKAVNNAFTPFAFPPVDIQKMETLMTKQPFNFDQLSQEAANAGREQVEAFIKSGTIFAKGFEDIIKTAASMTQDAAEKQAEFARKMMGSKTLNEFAETQNKIAQANFDQFMAGATKLSEMSVKVLNDASEPLNSQMTKGIQKVNKAMAA